jgi:hypothetical protein
LEDVGHGGMKVAEMEVLIKMIEAELPELLILENLMEVLVVQVVVIETMRTNEDVKIMILKNT